MMPDSFLRSLDLETMRSLLRDAPAMFLMSLPDGKILWGNESFCQWSGYTLVELERISWLDLSAPGEDLQSDIEMAQALASGAVSSYTQQKSYKPKNGRPILGSLTVIRVPPGGDLKFCFCHWRPLEDSSADAVALAMRQQKEIEGRLEQFSKSLDAMIAQTDEQKFVASAVSMAAKYPKTTLAIIVAILSLSGLDSVVTTLQRLNILPPPQFRIDQKQLDGTGAINQIMGLPYAGTVGGPDPDDEAGRL